MNVAIGYIKDLRSQAGDYWGQWALMIPLSDIVRSVISCSDVGEIDT